MLPKVVFEQTAFVKLKFSKNLNKTLMNQILKKQPNIYRQIHTSPWILKISREKKSANQESRDYCQVFVISNKKSLG
jgi:hypothetical protein